MMAFWALGAEETIGDAWLLRIEGPEFLFWPAIGVAAAAPGVLALMRPDAGARRWVNLTLRLLETGAIIAVLAIAIYGFTLVENEDGRGAYITVLVFSLFALAAFLVGRQALTSDARAGRPVVVGVAGALVVIGIVKAAVLGSSDSADVAVGTATVISAYFVFAVVIVLALTAPKSVRDELGAFSFAQASVNGAPGQQPVASPAGQPGAPGYAAGGYPPAAGTPGPSAAAAPGAPAPGQPWPQQPVPGQEAVPAEQPPEQAPEEKAAAGGEQEASTGEQQENLSEASPSEAGPGTKDSASTEVFSSAEAAPEEDGPAAEAPTTVFQGGMQTEDRPTQAFPATEEAAGEPAHDADTATGATPSAQPGDVTGDQPTEVLSATGPQEAPEPEAAASGFTAEMASDPNTALQTLADIAQREPSLRPHIAMNPSTYPGLLEWLAQLGDPAVDDALRRRQQR